MSNTVDFRKADTASDEFIVKKPELAVQETFWGYIVKEPQQSPLATTLLQGLSLLFGASLVTSAIGIWIIPSNLAGPDMVFMRLFATIVLGALAFALLWYASRGTAVEVQVDTTLGEMREVVRNRAGQPSLYGRFGFDAVKDLKIDKVSGKFGIRTLTVDLGEFAQPLPIATGPESEINRLAARMRRDLMVAAPGKSLRATAKPAVFERSLA